MTKLRHKEIRGLTLDHEIRLEAKHPKIWGPFYHALLSLPAFVSSLLWRSALATAYDTEEVQEVGLGSQTPAVVPHQHRMSPGPCLFLGG